MKDIVKELKDRTLKIAILKIISEREIGSSHLVEAINTRSKGYFNIKEDSFYPILYGLQADGIIENSWKGRDSLGTAPIKYYSLTSEGDILLKKLLEEWGSLLEGISNIFT